ncbi:hypothetical protein [Candidatus Igneacidithiobacillus taiwanensis]|uniref:hypothetical protein n=1 Tax=Candidatus Igneacidithiobacillus taiwanensis TaxID=1945924 RepID=UPI00289E7D0B|nr:hypothetical protein [Candidatus Igneacidithiobacillus taiwanensis]
MAQAARTITRNIGGGVSVTFTVPDHVTPGTVSYMTAEWDPDIPTKMSGKMKKNYKRALNEAVALVGVKALIIEV